MQVIDSMSTFLLFYVHRLYTQVRYITTWTNTAVHLPLLESSMIYVVDRQREAMYG